MKKLYTSFMLSWCIVIFMANGLYAAPVTVTGGTDALTVYGFVPDMFAVDIIPLNAAESGESLTLTRTGMSNYDICKLTCVTLSANAHTWTVSITCQDSYGVSPHPAFTPKDIAKYPAESVQDITYTPYIKAEGGTKTSFPTGSYSVNIETEGAATFITDTFYIGFDIEQWGKDFQALEVNYTTDFVITVTTA
ncbi:MAG: hypothetical protein SPD11_05145 [Sphaerochaetaceae bacterium]|nr:hypothetical protein [Sphaerochaetaceae bacterium]